MAALEWFESIARLRVRVRELEDDMEQAYASAGPHGLGATGAGGGAGAADALAGVDRLLDAGTADEYLRERARLEAEMERASLVLYGRSGRGGLARALGYGDADVLMCHYLQGMGWTEIARQIVRPEPMVEYPSLWCRRKAESACRYIDRVGCDYLMEL